MTKRPGRKLKPFFFSLCILVMFSPLQAETENLNYYYQHPFAFGLDYQQILVRNQPLRNYNFFLFDLGLDLRAPLSFFPYLQPAVRTGIIRGISSMDVEVPSVEPDHDLFSHYQVYGLAGLHLVNRFAKNWEAGIFGYAGFSRGHFPNIAPTEQEVRFQRYFLAEGGLRFTVIPQYNISLDLHPTLRYQKTLSGAFLSLDGWTWAVNCALSFRLREDPDLELRQFKSIDFERVELPAVFAALQNYYMENPLGYMTITNRDDAPVYDLKISFFQEGFMDVPTPSRSIEVLNPGESLTVPLYAVFNQAVLNTVGRLPLNGEITLLYERKGLSGKQTTPVVYELHDKTSLTWDDDRKVAAFVTPADSLLRDYGSLIRQSLKAKGLPLLNQPLQTAMLIYAALGESGCCYQADSVSPYAVVAEDMFAVDSVQLARETLKLRGGDCDDLSVLFLSLWEAAGVETGFITIPGHIYPAFNTGVGAEDFRDIHPDGNMFIIYRGELWIPVEVSLLGEENFLKAWYTGVRQFFQYTDKPEQCKFYLTREAQQIYQPLSLQREDIVSLPALPREGLENTFTADLAELSGVVLAGYRHSVEAEPVARNYLNLGKALALFGKGEEAGLAFRRVLELDPTSPFPRIYIGNLRFQTGDYQGALLQYREQLEAFAAAGDETSELYLRLLLRISISYYMLQDLERAQEYYALAYALSPESTRAYAYLAGDFSRSTRGSRQSVYNLFPPFAEENLESP